ncbi:HAD hydrolase-like protein [Actinomyces respiraculi]|uniref:HAD hydrolase-like protein n=1 Tax=Actinomyces respiraculi TaxID=2744574 RepID=UPI0018E07C22|nr:HAD hydrolase-like protein [Actinomyces respiraculi]
MDALRPPGPPTTPVTAVLLDLDGTLIDSGPTILDAFAHTLSDLGLAVGSREELGVFIGPPLHEGFRLHAGLEGQDVDEAVRIYRSHYTQHMHEAPVYDGVPELLDALAAAGVPTCLATSKREDLAVRLLEHKGLVSRLTATAGADLADRGGRKAEVIGTAVRRLGEAGADTSRVVHVGDRAHDVEGAHEAGVECVGVLWGYGDAEEMAGADWLVDSPAQLSDLLTGLTGLPLGAHVSEAGL